MAIACEIQPPDHARRPGRTGIPACALLALATLLFVSPAAAQIEYPTFMSVEGLTLVGSTVHRPPVARLTENGRSQAGALWSARKIRVVDGFVTTFRFQFTQTGGRQDEALQNGGDGIAFVVQNSAPDIVGGPGGAIGYSGVDNAVMIDNGVAVEFDTYYNDALTINDRSPNHVAVQRGPRLTSNHARSLDSTSRIPWLDDGGVHTVVIEYIEGRLKVFIDNCDEPAIDIPFDLEANVRLDSGRAWVGFTSSTGDAWENHDLLSWRLHSVNNRDVDGVLCLGDTLTLAPDGIYQQYLWSTGATSPSIRVAHGGSYSVMVVDTLGCSDRPRSFVWTLEEHELQRPEISPTDTVWLCAGESLRLDGGCCMQNFWSTGERTREIVVTQPGLYWEDVIDAWGCRGRSDSVRVLVRPNPSPVITALGPTEICRGDSVVLVATEHARYRWSTGDTTRSIVARESGQYSVEVVDENGCRAATDVTVVIVLPVPRPVVAFRGPSALCAGAETVLDAGSGYERYLWSTGDTTRLITVRSSGTYSVTVTTDRGCEGASAAVSVRVTETPAPRILVDRTGPICPGELAVLSADRPYARYLWSNGDTASAILVGEAGAYTLTVIDSNGCEGTSPPVDVIVAPPADATIIADGPITLCAGDSVGLTAPAGLRSYRWSTGASERRIRVGSSGRYVVTVVDTNGCTASDTLDVRVDALPAPVASPDIRICSGDSAQITAFGVSTVRWEPAEGLDCPDCPTTVARPARTTTYVATATGPGGCRASDSVTVVVTPSIAATLAVEDGGTVYPGRKRSVPVYLLGDLEEAGADEAIVRVDYGSAMLRLESIRPVGPFTGWALERLEEIPGRFTARLSAPPATTLRGTGEALALEFQTFLGDSTVSRISVEMTLLRRPCVTLTSRPGSLRLDSLCGMNGRLIEALDGTLSLAQNTPNPFNPSTMLVFTVPVDGPVRLDVLDAEGAVVEHLVDADLAAGTHEIVWDATGFSSGLYFARLSAGSGSQSIQMLLLK